MNKTSTFPVEDKNDVIIKVVTFLISPFLSFLYSLLRMDTKSSYVVFFLFSVFFGMAFSVSEVMDEMSYYIDGVFYRMQFDNYCSSSFYNFQYEWRDFISLKGYIKDFYFNAIAFGISRITTNYHVMFVVFAAVFAYFQLRCFSFFTQEKNYRNGIVALLLAFIFTWNQIININGVRFNTAAWVYVYCVFQIFFNDNKKYFILLAFTPFIHAAFWVYSIFLCLAFLLKKYKQFWKVAFFISFFVSSASTVLLRYVQTVLPDIFSAFIDQYAGVESSSEVIVTSSISGFLLSVSSLFSGFLIFWLILKYQNDKDERINNVFSAFVVLATFMNFFMPISSLGSRMILMIYPLLAYLWIHCFDLKKYNWMIYVFLMLMVISIRSKLQMYLMVTNTSFWYSNPIKIISQYLL